MRGLTKKLLFATLSLSSIGKSDSLKHFQSKDHKLEERSKEIDSLQIKGVRVNGNLIGIHLTNIKKGSTLQKLGIKERDVVMAVDKFQVDSYRSGRAAINLIYEKKQATVKLLRNRTVYFLNIGRDTLIKTEDG